MSRDTGSLCLARWDPKVADAAVAIGCKLNEPGRGAVVMPPSQGGHDPQPGGFFCT